MDILQDTCIGILANFFAILRFCECFNRVLKGLFLIFVQADLL